MKRIVAEVLLALFLLEGASKSISAQGCSACQGGANGAQGNDAGVSFNFSMGAAQYGQSAGSLVFSSALPDTNLYTPALLQFTAPTRTDVVVITNSAGIRQVNAPQALADVIVINTNAYRIDYYYPTNVGSISGGVYSVSGSPYLTWTITNTSPSTNTQLRVSESSVADGLLKQWDYTYATNTGVWSAQTLGGVVQENNNVIPLSTNTYQIVNTVQASGGPVVQRVATTFQTFSWGTAPIQIALGSTNAPQITTYTYDSSPTYGNGSPAPLTAVTNADGSTASYTYGDPSGNPTAVVSTFGDTGSREIDYDYTTSNVSGSGDDGTISTNTPRLTVTSIAGNEVSRSYTVFPSAYVRLDIQCATAGAAWNASDNLFTTNIYYTNGANQFALKAVVHPDKTLTTYDYVTNSSGTCQTNITATGQPDSTFTHVVDGTTNYTVLNQYGYMVLSVSADIKSTNTILLQDTYGNFDGYGRPQQVTHLDGTTEYTQYACCGLDNTTDRDGVVTQYLYDQAKRQTAYVKYYGTNGITYTNVLDAAGRTLQSIRIGTDNSTIILHQTSYDLAGEILMTTNALGGVTSYGRSTNVSTGGLIRAITNADGGTITNYYYADGSLKQTLGTAARPVTYVYSSGSGYQYTQTYKLDSSGGSNEWVQTYTDMLGRPYETYYADSSVSYSYYNLLGQLTNEIDPDGVSMLYAYNPKGERMYSILDANQDHVIDYSGSDRITFTTNDVTSDYSSNVRRMRTWVFTTGGATASNLISTVERSVDGLKSWNTVWNNGSGITSSNQTGYATNGFRYTTNWSPDGSFSVSTYQYGRLLSTLRTNTSLGQLSFTTNGYDAHGRQSTLYDAATGTTTYTFNNSDQVATVTSPSPTEVTTSYFDNMGRMSGTTLPDSTSTTNLFYLTSQIKRTYGSRTYPVGYGYDAQGRMTKMTNWTGFASGVGSRVTTWNYDAYRGFLSGKTYDGGAAGPSYAYTNSGRLMARSWARGTNTSYMYNNAGDLATVIYDDGVTPGITNGYDRRGRLTTISNAAQVCTVIYNDANQVLSEAYTGGPLDGMAVTNGYDNLLRRTNCVTLHSGTVLTSAAYGYDAASRLVTVSDGTNSAAYGYLANSPLVQYITNAQSGTMRMTTTKAFDNLNRLTSISSDNASSVVLDSHGYAYNSANQRTSVTSAEGTYWVYQYDSLGQVTSGIKYWGDGTVVAGQQFGYGFDDIGNRTTTSAGGDQWGANLRYENYTANSLNQYTSRTVPGALDVIGSATNTATVTVNNQTTYRKGNYFRAQLPLNNLSGAVWQSITNLAVLNEGTADVRQTNLTNNAFLPQTPESFTYDADGNLTRDGRWIYTWDAENRLVSMTNNSGVPTGARMRLDFGYDYKGRRVSKNVVISGVTNAAQFVYDGWNLVAETGAGNALLRSYVWGNDLSGSLQGAGGIGGLLEMTYYGFSTTNCFPTYDGNGNVSALVNAANGLVLAQYEYGPFGEVIRASGPMAKLNPFRFSTKYQDDENDLLYYGLRFYNPSVGRWISRDPIEEKGGANLYGFVGNDSLNQVDRLGLICVPYWVTKGNPYYATGTGTLPIQGYYECQVLLVTPYTISWFCCTGWQVPIKWPLSWPPFRKLCTCSTTTSIYNSPKVIARDGGHYAPSEGPPATVCASFWAKNMPPALP